MTAAVFRVGLPDGSIRLAAGSIDGGPASLLPVELTIGGLLAHDGSALASALDGADAGPAVPDGARLLAPVDDQEVWAAGVTYERSRDARMEESAEPSIYDRVYDAARPELFFKAPAWRVRGSGEPIGIRADSDWNVPEPELGLVIAADLTIAGYVMGDDVSSRTIEGENPLYLPQAKSYRWSCALGPAIVPASAVQPPFPIRVVIVRGGATVFDEATSTERIRRPLAELVSWLGRAMDFPAGAVLLTGTGIVPPASFTLAEGDVVSVDGGPLGRLVNTVQWVGGT